MQTKEDFEDEGFTNEYDRFIDNPLIADIVGPNTGCIMSFTHNFPDSYTTTTPTSISSLNRRIGFEVSGSN